ncbi:MAG: flagellar hook-associated protein FlgL [Betaproteobacteria bacterium]
MRVSTSQIYDAGSRNIIDGQGAVYKTQNQLSTGRRFLTPQDDPVAAAQVLLDTQAREVTAQYADNQSNASTQLSLEESRLSSVVEAVQYIKEQVVAGGNASYSDSQRATIASNLQSQFDALLGIANSADASGHYLFSGFQGETQPFQLTTTGAVNYVGDDGQRLLQVGASRQIAVSDSGRDIFNNIRSGNGTFTTAAPQSAPLNTGTGVIYPGTVNNPQSWTGHNYQISFTAPGTYDVIDTTAGLPAIATGVAYATGAAITAIPGISFTIGGVPSAGDKFNVTPSTDQSLFTTLKNMITAFGTPVAGNDTLKAKVRSDINAGMAGLDQALDNVAGVQASIGSRMKELQGLSDISSSLDIQYKDKISKLQDLDYTAAISLFTSQQTQLEAAQKSFAQISGLSLFKYI